MGNSGNKPVKKRDRGPDLKEYSLVRNQGVNMYWTDEHLLIHVRRTCWGGKGEGLVRANGRVCPA